MSRRLALASCLLLLAGCGSGGGPEPTPAVTSVFPVGGPVAGGTDVVVIGTGFVSGATVRLGGAVVRATFVSDRELHLLTPAHAAGRVAVQVENPAGKTDTLPDAFTYALPPTAVVAGTLRAPVGTAVALDGSATVDPSLLGLTWQWTFVSRPAGSVAGLGRITTPVATLTLDAPGRYVASLVVTNLGGASAPATVEVVTIPTGSVIPDGGQVSCYDDAAKIACPAAGAPWFGQDGQYLIRPQRYAAGAGVVTDLVTGLDWQAVGAAAKVNFFEAAGIEDATYNPGPAVDVCGGLDLGGHQDWRLPSRREIFSLLMMEWSPGQPFADLAAFPDTHAGLQDAYWTSSLSATVDLPWAVEFGDGRATYGYGSRASGLWTRCVRGAPWGVSAFVDQRDGTVRDDGTGLVWEQAPAAVAYSWAEALAHCEALPLAGGGWRLPSSKELDALIPGTLTMPALDPTLFPGTGNDRFWTSTTIGWLPADALAGDMASAWLDGPFDKGTSYFARCVR